MFQAVQRFVKEFNRGQNVMYGDQHYKRQNSLRDLFRKVRLYGRRKH